LKIDDRRLRHSIADWAIVILMIVSIMIGESPFVIGAIANAAMPQSTIECRNAAIDGIVNESSILNLQSSLDA
jgi:hypothetical protein